MRIQNGYAVRGGWVWRLRADFLDGARTQPHPHGFETLIGINFCEVSRGKGPAATVHGAIDRDRALAVRHHLHEADYVPAGRGRVLALADVEGPATAADRQARDCCHIARLELALTERRSTGQPSRQYRAE